MTRRRPLIAVAFALGIALRLVAATAGSNYDVDSFQIVGNLVAKGASVYANTPRYNYGPLWALVLGGLTKVQHAAGLTSVGSYHLLIATLLTWVDLLLAWSLSRWIDGRLGLLYLLNPVAILTTGFHSQFEGLAVLFGLWSWLLLRRAEEPIPSWRALLASAALLGLSLVTKHVLLFLPLWILWWRPAGPWHRRVAYCAVAYAVFLGSFVPYLGDPRARAGIVEHVFRYRSFADTAFGPRLFELFAPLGAFETWLSWLPVFSGARALWPIAMILVGRHVARRRPDEVFFVHLIALLVFTPALSIQQLTIPVAACAYFWRRWELMLYTATATLVLLASGNNLAGNPTLRGYLSWPIALDLQPYNAIAWLAVFLGVYLWETRPRGRASSTPSFDTSEEPGYMTPPNTLPMRSLQRDDPARADG